MWHCRQAGRDRWIVQTARKNGPEEICPGCTENTRVNEQDTRADMFFIRTWEGVGHEAVSSQTHSTYVLRLSLTNLEFAILTGLAR